MSLNPNHIHLAHLAAFGPLFLYVGLARDNVPDHLFNVLGFIAVVMLVYHAYRAYTKLKENKSAWINWIHIFLIAPLLLIVAYLKKDANRRYFEMILLAGFAAIGYHGTYLIRDTMFN